MKSTTLMLAAFFTLSFFSCKKASVDIPNNPTEVKEDVEEEPEAQPHKYGYLTDSVCKYWHVGRSENLVRARYDSTTSSTIIYHIDTTYTDTTIKIHKINDTTIQFLALSLTFKHVDSVNKFAFYEYRFHPYAASYRELKYYYEDDSLYYKIVRHISAGGGDECSIYYSK